MFQPWSDWLAYLSIIINVYTSGAYISGFILICHIIWETSFITCSHGLVLWHTSSCPLIPHWICFFLEIQRRVHYENFISCYVHRMLKRIRPAVCVTEKVLQILLWNSWCADPQLFSQTIVLPLTFDLPTSRFF